MAFRFDLDDLQLFVHVVDTGSITQGAARAHLALASASARIRQLEVAFGTSLLERRARGVQPTPAGLALSRHARGLLDQAATAVDELDGFSGGLRGVVRVLCNTVSHHEYLPDRLGPFLARHPQVNVEISEALGDAVVQGVAEGLADVGIVATPIDAGTLETRLFGRDELVLVIPRGHPIAARARGDRVDAVAMDGHGIVGLVAGSALQDQWEAASARRGQRLTYRARVPSFEAQCRLVEAGAGVSLMPRAAARRLADPDRVQLLAVDHPTLARDLLLVVRRLADLPTFARELVLHLQAPDGGTEAGVAADRHGGP